MTGWNQHNNQTIADKAFFNVHPTRVDLNAYASYDKRHRSDEPRHLSIPTKDTYVPLALLPQSILFGKTHRSFALRSSSAHA